MEAVNAEKVPGEVEKRLTNYKAAEMGTKKVDKRAKELRAARDLRYREKKSEKKREAKRVEKDLDDRF